MKIILYLILFLLAIIHSGCICDCYELDNSILFQFSLDSTQNGFKKAEIDTIIIYRLTKNTLEKVDSALINPDCEVCPIYGFTLKEGKPFPSNYKFWEYDYLIKTQGNAEFYITQMNMEIKKKGSFSCRCSVNTSKKFKINNRSYHSVWIKGVYHPKFVVLTKF